MKATFQAIFKPIWSQEIFFLNSSKGASLLRPALTCLISTGIQSAPYQVCKPPSAVVSECLRYVRCAPLRTKHGKIIQQVHKEAFEKCTELWGSLGVFACLMFAIPGHAVSHDEQIGAANPRPFWQLSPYFLTELPGQCGPTTAVASAVPDVVPQSSISW